MTAPLHLHADRVEKITRGLIRPGAAPLRRILQIPCADPPIRPVSTRKPPKLPKSTVSSSLNSLHQKGVIRKVKKGRENLIRLVQSPGDMSDD
jgi:hypothetical protein